MATLKLGSRGRIPRPPPKKQERSYFFFIENQSFFDNSFDRYPIGEKTEVADSEKRTPEAKFRPFVSSILVFPESHKNKKKQGGSHDLPIG